jgi:hypothetical protein
VVMPSDGATIFDDLVGKLDTLRVTCSKCEREGRYSVRRLIEQHRATAKSPIGSPGLPAIVRASSRST